MAESLSHVSVCHIYADVLYYMCRYSYDEQSGTYNEMQGEQTGVHTEVKRDGVTE
jgi:hypothetical protein